MTTLQEALAQPEVPAVLGRAIGDGISCSTTSQTFAGIARIYSRTIRFRIPMI